MSFKKKLVSFLYTKFPKYFERSNFRTLNNFGIADILDGKLIFNDEVPTEEPITINEIDESITTPNIVHEKFGLVLLDKLPPITKLPKTEQISEWLTHDKDHRWMRGINPNCFTSSGASGIYIYEDHVLFVERVTQKEANKHKLPKTEDELFNIIS